jgi:hypothetical protein
LIRALRTKISIAMLAGLASAQMFAQNSQTAAQPSTRPAQQAPSTVPAQVQLFIPYKQYSREENQRILKLYEPLRVSDVSDGMDVVGCRT